MTESTCPGFGEEWSEGDESCNDCKECFPMEYYKCKELTQDTDNMSCFGHNRNMKAGYMDSLIIEGTNSVKMIEKKVIKKFGSCRKYSLREHLSHLRLRHNINANVDKHGTVKIT